MGLQDCKIIELKKIADRRGNLTSIEAGSDIPFEIKRVFPDRPIVDLPRSHAIFHCVFDIPNDLNIQCPAIPWGVASQYTGRTWEREDAQEVHIRGIYDDKGRLCVIICHNTDNGDGWEREGESEYYFREFSEKKAYPLGINIIFYAMTH